MPSITKNPNYTRKRLPVSAFATICGKQILAGVYRIYSPRGSYVGSTINLPRRLRTHNFVLAKGGHHSPILQSAYNKYGMLYVEILFSASPLVSTRASLLRREQRFMDKLIPRYNCSLQARSPASDPRVGKKISVANTGRVASKETRAKISASKMGHTVSAAARRKMSKAKRGIPLSKDHRQALSDSLRGRIFSKETRARMSITRIGIKFSAETCKRISQSKAGKPTGRRDIETRSRMLAANLRMSEKQLSELIARVRCNLKNHNARKTARMLGISYKTVLHVARNHATYCHVEEKYRG